MLLSALALVLMAWLHPAVPLFAGAALLVLLVELVSLPVAFFRHALDRRYELTSQGSRAWLRDQAKGFALTLVFAVAAATTVYALIAWSPRWWWIAAAVLGTALTAVLARLAPILLLPLFYRFQPLDRPLLTARLVDLSRRAGVPVLGVYEWGMGAKTRRANAALVGAGATRRILISDTMLAEYSDDEIEVILAHELAHHVHRDIPKGIALEFVLLLAAGLAASVVLNTFWRSLGLQGPADPAGLPILALVAGAVMLLSAPAVNAYSRANERRADAFALALTRRGDAFVSAMRRLGQQNLAEEHPSRTTVWLFHSHPPIEERILTGMQALPPEL